MDGSILSGLGNGRMMRHRLNELIDENTLTVEDQKFHYDPNCKVYYFLKKLPYPKSPCDQPKSEIIKDENGDITAVSDKLKTR
jgi:hypothetical protein